MMFSRVLGDRRELVESIDENDESVVYLDWSSLVYGRNPSDGDAFEIRTNDAIADLRVSLATPDEIDDDDAGLYFAARAHHGNYLKASIGVSHRYIPWTSDVLSARFRRRQAPYEAGFPPPLTFRRLGPDVVTDGQLDRMWGGIALTDDAEDVVESLGRMYGHKVLDLAFIGDNTPRQSNRRAMVRLQDHGSPVPLKSLGDGSMRVVGHMMALARKDTDILFVDEIENGIHHRVLTDYWRMVFASTDINRTQLVATTHSYDCIKAFAQVAEEQDDDDCILIRLGETRFTKKMRAVEYSREDLNVATRHRIEVR